MRRPARAAVPTKFISARGARSSKRAWSDPAVIAVPDPSDPHQPNFFGASPSSVSAQDFDRLHAEGATSWDQRGGGKNDERSRAD